MNNSPGTLIFQGFRGCFFFLWHEIGSVSAGYERVKRAFGPEQVEAAVEAAKQREQAEKARKRPRRSCDRGGR